MRVLDRLMGMALVFAAASCTAPTPPPRPAPVAQPYPPSPAPRPVVVSVPPLPPAAVASAPAIINDHALIEALERSAPKLVSEGKVVPLAELRPQLGRKQCSLRLLQPSAQRLTPAQVYEQCRSSVLVIGGLHKCDKCPRWHAGTSCAFPLTASGAIVTNYHVVANKEHYALVAMSCEGALFPVREVLAASQDDDVAILQLDAPGAVFRPLALSPRAPVGAPVCVISHPDRHFYALTCGIVSRYVRRAKAGRPATWMEITADYARGSSGGPVLDERGAVAGLVASTESVYYKIVDGRKEDLQMVFKDCVPAESVLKLIRP